MPVENPQQVTNRILAHYDANARILPWRAAPGAALPDPYRVWLSEIMLQQTTVAAVKPYFKRFLAHWPSVVDLANAADADVMQSWAGLGYYARARNLLACARVVATEHNGAFPATEDALRALPGIGAYTAAAIASIAFGARAVVVDGNVERVLARYHAIETPLPAAKAQIRGFADVLTPERRAGDFAQAMMDLGATICTPRSPACTSCPLGVGCKGRNDPTRYPVKLPKSLRPARRGTAWLIERDRAVWLVRRPAKGLLGGMLALPTCNWKGVGQPPAALNWAEMGEIEHVFTHFRLSLAVQHGQLSANQPISGDGEWWPIDRLDEAGLPSVFLKAAKRALSGENSQ
jgi:A/G-specific adenine glycosylase